MGPQQQLNKRYDTRELRGPRGNHLLYTGLQASECLFHHLETFLCSSCVSSCLSQHTLNIQRLVMGPGYTLPEGHR